MVLQVGRLDVTERSSLSYVNQSKLIATVETVLHDVRRPPCWELTL